MNNKFVLTLVCILLSLSTPIHSRNKTTHLISASATVGYSTIVEDYNDLNTFGKTGGGLGINYELRNNHFSFTTGLEGQLLKCRTQFTMPAVDAQIYDTQGKIATMHYQIGSVTENIQSLYVAVPIIFGYYNNGFYIGGGFKVAMPIKSTVTSAYKYSTSATYNEYMEDFENMHDYGSYDRVSKNKLNSAIKYSLVAEVGYNILSAKYRRYNNYQHGLRISAVCEYSLNNLVKTPTATPIYDINPNNANDLNIHPYFSANSTQNHIINHLYIGAKLTWTFRLTQGRCTTCE